MEAQREREAEQRLQRLHARQVQRDMQQDELIAARARRVAEAQAQLEARQRGAQRARSEAQRLIDQRHVSPPRGSVHARPAAHTPHAHSPYLRPLSHPLSPAPQAEMVAREATAEARRNEIRRQQSESAEAAR